GRFPRSADQRPADYTRTGAGRNVSRQSALAAAATKDIGMFFSGRGDDGYTDLLGGPRVAKYDLRPEALGALDEASAALGLARAHAGREETRRAIIQAQRDLYLLMADIATIEGRQAGQP